MEFNFNINRYFKDEITKIGPRLIPDGFLGDRRDVQDCYSKVSQILTVLGEKSAKAQGLQKVITSGEKLRNTDHVVYILIDPKGGTKGLGTVLGMLKVGVKHLYVFDTGGNNHEVTTKCVLDFYVHESKQRMGLGKKLFQYMLKEERVDPVHLAIDKPSSKFLSFLLKHYGLQTIIPQMNNFVVFEGFFSDRQFGGGSEEKEKLLPAGVSSCGTRYKSRSTGYSPTSPTSPHHYKSASAININHPSYYGRQAPHKPVSTVGMILQHKQPSPSQQPPQNGSIKESESIDYKREKPAEEPSGEDNKIEEDVSVSENKLEEEKKEEEETQTKDAVENKESIIMSVAPGESIKSPGEISNSKIRQNSQGHLDLKFYHSTLW